ncbi:T9SS type A sorting domain-containing protein, partial [Segetibacter sp. 3557_3]|uniref:T9SS type A sorting domain-containing protein n=1 Tax=Segetibacter sp. 3557_3 TaxID=2547429 RepID=UPI0010585CCB
VARSLTNQTIPAGASTYTFDVTVNGDNTVEPNETFFVNVTGVTGAVIADGQGVGTISNDDGVNCDNDNVPPVIIAKNATVYIGPNGVASIQPADVIQSLTDNCALDPTSVTVSPNTFSCANIAGGSPVNHQAYIANTNTGNQVFAGELGMDFQVKNAGGIVINQLGAFDHQGDGIKGHINGAIRVAIFDKKTMSIVPGLDALVSGTGDSYMNNYRFKNITPVTLPAGDYLIVAKGYNIYELNGNVLIGAGTVYPFGDAGNGAVTFGNNAYYGENQFEGFRYPTNTYSLQNPNVAAYLAGSFNYTSGASFSNMVTITAKDAKGNVATANAQLTVLDTIAPVIITKNVTVSLDANGTATIQPADVIQSVTDNCSVNTASYTVSPNTFTCANFDQGTANTTHQAYVANTNMGNQVFAGELGTDFRVNDPKGIVITQLGAFDHQGDGIKGHFNGAVRVAIFDKRTMTIVPGLDALISGTADNYMNNFRFKTIAPVTLPVGDYLIVAKGYNIYELNGNVLVNPGTVYPFGDSAKGAISFGHMAFYGSNVFEGFSYPTNTYTLENPNSVPYLAGSFNFDTKDDTGNTVMVTATDIYGNVAKAMAKVFVSNPLGVCNSQGVRPQFSRTEPSVPAIVVEQLKVYPNPTNGDFTVQVYDLKAPQATVQILNNNGTVIEQKSVGLTGKTASLMVRFNLRSQPAGMYLVKLITAEGVRTTKFVLAH